MTRWPGWIVSESEPQAPVGGGGLSAGVRMYLAERAPATELRFVEPAGGASLRAALAVGHPLSLSKVDSFVDGAAVEANFQLAARNIPQIDVLPIQGINVFDIMRRDTLVLTKAAVEALTERFK